MQSPHLVICRMQIAETKDLIPIVNPSLLPIIMQFISNEWGLVSELFTFSMVILCLPSITHIDVTKLQNHTSNIKVNHRTILRL